MRESRICRNFQETIMPDRDGPRSNPYHPNAEMCCEACVFGRGEHARWCERRAGTGAEALPERLAIASERARMHGTARKLHV